MIPLGDFIEKCILLNDFHNSCYSAYFVLFFGFLLFILNFYAFIKMTKYYGKMNFENTILLLSSMQSTFLLIEVIIEQNILISFFIFLQILSMCLINFKFKKISKGFFNLKYINLTKIISIINMIYLFIFIFVFIANIILEEEIIHITFYLSIFYYLLEIISSFLLTYNCCAFLGIIKQYKLKEIPKSKEETENYFLKFNMVGDGLFYLIKKRQITLLYLGNILCTFIEFGIDFVITFIFKKLNNFEYHNYFYYSYFFLCFIHNSIIFISFYWLIKEQYNISKAIDIDDDVEENEDNRLIDDKYIKEEIVNIQNENKRISGYIDEEKKNKYDDRDTSFCSMDIDIIGQKGNNNNDIPKNENEYNGFIIINNKK